MSDAAGARIGGMWTGAGRGGGGTSSLPCGQAAPSGGNSQGAQAPSALSPTPRLCSRARRCIARSSRRCSSCWPTCGNSSLSLGSRRGSQRGRGSGVHGGPWGILLEGLVRAGCARVQVEVAGRRADGQRQPQGGQQEHRRAGLQNPTEGKRGVRAGMLLGIEDFQDVKSKRRRRI